MIPTHSLLLSFTGMLALAGPMPDVALSREARLLKDIGRVQLAREEKLMSFAATEHYTLHNTRFSTPAEMTVSVSYEKGTGKTFRVLSRRGPSFLQSAVMDRILKEETEMSQGEARLASLVTEANYEMKSLGVQSLNGRNCDVIALEPRKKSPHLLRATAWLDSVSHNVIRIEGKPTASISFWAGAPHVEREYVEIGQFSFAKRSQAMSQNFLLGKSELTVDYSGYQVNGAGAK